MWVIQFNNSKLRYEWVKVQPVAYSQYRGFNIAYVKQGENIHPYDTKSGVDIATFCSTLGSGTDLYEAMETAHQYLAMWWGKHTWMIKERADACLLIRPKSINFISLKLKGIL